MDIINLTPHKVTVVDGNGEVLNEFPPSGMAARVLCEYERKEDVQGIHVYVQIPKQVVDLPDPVDGTRYIVSGMVLGMLPDRKDLVAPNNLVRDEEGNITGCRSFVRNL
jgi:hypothetical protein